MTTLERRLGNVVVRVPAADSGATVWVGSSQVPPAGWEVPIPVDPGDVVVRASSGDGRVFNRTVRVSDGRTAEVTIALTAPAPVATSRGTQPTTAVPSEPQRPAEDGGAGVGPWLVAGAGAAMLAGAAVLWSLHASAISARDNACDADGCNASAIDDDARARSLTLGTNVLLAVGGAAIAGGVTWFFVARARPRAERTASPTAWVSPGGAGLAVGGRF